MIEDIKPSSQPAPASPSNGKKILCIEDELFIGELYARALKKAGYEVVVILDGRKGLEEAKTDKYDIVLLDIMIPQMLGIDVLHELRKDTPDLKAKLIIATNLEQDEKTRAKIESEADGYIIKAEVTPKQLVEFLSHF
jgi:DNA-binding response OmpR family regulator